MIFFRPNFPSIQSLLGTVRLFFLDQISPFTQVSPNFCFVLYDYLFWNFFQNFFKKGEKKPTKKHNVHRPLTNGSNERFQHSNIQKLRIKFNCVLCCFKISAYSVIITFHDGEELKDLLLLKKRNQQNPVSSIKKNMKIKKKLKNRVAKKVC